MWSEKITTTRSSITSYLEEYNFWQHSVLPISSCRGNYPNQNKLTGSQLVVIYYSHDLLFALRKCFIPTKISGFGLNAMYCSTAVGNCLCMITTSHQPPSMTPVWIVGKDQQTLWTIKNYQMIEQKFKNVYQDIFYRYS